MDATRRVAADPGWLRRINEAVRGGLSAEAAVHQVASDVRGRMRKIVDPYLRERLADLEDLAERLLTALDGGSETRVSAEGAILIARRLGPAQLLTWHARGIAGVAIEEGSAGGHAAILARALGLPAVGGARGAAGDGRLRRAGGRLGRGLARGLSLGWLAAGLSIRAGVRPQTDPRARRAEPDRAGLRDLS